ncbi:MAG TPA: hypothetical protein VMD02_00545 [Candidatus Omnitrophota bacterium]|nr:hypothetical protein [Candidatus Omnitrophota bacterium]
MKVEVNRAAAPPAMFSPRVQPGVAYLHKALGERAGLLLDELTEINGRLTDKNYSRAVPASRNISFTFSGQVVPPLVVVRPGEIGRALSFYEVSINHLESERYRNRYADSFTGFLVLAQDPGRRVLSYLNNYLLVVKPNGKMVMIADDHTHAAYAFGLARHLRAVPDNLVLFHADEHRDNVICGISENEMGPYRAERITLSRLAYCCKNAVEIDNYLDFSCRSGFLRPEDINYYLTENLGKRAAPAYSARSNMLRTGKIGLLGSLADDIKQARAGGAGAFLNLDLDLFAFLHDPFFPQEKKQELAGITEGQVLAPLLEAAHLADFVFIATSPDYFCVPVRTISRLVRKIVDAA